MLIYVATQVHYKYHAISHHSTTALRFTSTTLLHQTHTLPLTSTEILSPSWPQSFGITYLLLEETLYVVKVV